MITVAVLAYNEEENLALTVANVVQAGLDTQVSLDIIIINDGSRDRTPEVCRELENRFECVRSIHHPRNRGIGVGVREAIQAAKGDKFITVPGDNDVGMALLRDMFASHARADVILAYYLNKEKRGRRRNILSAVFNLIYMCTFNIFVQYVTGPAIYPTVLLRRFDLKSTRFSIPVEMTIKCLRTGCSYCEVGGCMVMGLEGSTSFSLRNLLEVIRTYFGLVAEVHFRRRRLFGSLPTRVP